MIFGNWRPGGLLVGAGCSATPTPLRLRNGGESVHALLLLVAVVLVGVGVPGSSAAAATIAGGRALVVAALAVLRGTSRPTRCPASSPA